MAGKWAYLYKTRRWQNLKAWKLGQNPLCEYCEKLQKYVKSKVVDHIVPHKGNADLMWDENNLQALCIRCHDNVKRREERTGQQYSTEIGADGFPIDRRHPFCKEPTSISTNSDVSPTKRTKKRKKRHTRVGTN